MKRVLDKEYIDTILGPAADKIIDEIATSYEQLESMSNDPTFYRGRISGLRQAFEILRQTAKNINKEQEDE